MAVAPMEWRQIFLTIIIVVETSEEEGLFAIVYKHMLILLLLNWKMTVERSKRRCSFLTLISLSVKFNKYRLNRKGDENFWTLYSCGKQCKNNHSFCKIYFIPLCFTNYKKELSVIFVINVF